MYHDESEYPHDWEDIPDLGALIHERDWEVLLVYDACRWDAFVEVCDDADPVSTFAAWSTPDFTTWWGSHRDGEFDDVTYVSGNPITSIAHTYDRFDSEDRIDHAVGTYVEAFRDSTAVDDRETVVDSETATETAWDSTLGTARPDDLTDIASQYDPPLVVHYMQPHTPFIGDVALDVPSKLPDVALDVETNHSEGAEYGLAIEGHVSTEFVRAAYLENIKVVHRETKPLREEYDAVVTADHGERLGPDRWDHGGPDTNAARVVPWARY